MPEQSGEGVGMERGGEVDKIVSEDERKERNKLVDEKREEKIANMNEVIG